MTGLLAVAPHAVQAQSSATYSTLSQPPGQPARKPAAKPAPVAERVNPAEQSDFWQVNTSLGSYSSDRPKSQSKAAGTRAPGPSESTPLDRVRLRDTPGGSIGLAAGQSTRSGQFHDGRDVPGLTANTQRESSYVGLSLSVSSNSKGLPIPVPAPAPNPWNRNE